MEAMDCLISTALYLVLHFLLYAVALRHLRLFRREWGIFGYHAVSALVLVVVCATWLVVAPRPENFAIAGGALALHGLYSLSFLEVWALAEGGYSLAILARVAALRAAGAGVDLAALQRIGGAKKGARLSSVQRLGLVRRRGERLELSGLGRAVAALFALLAWTADLKKVG
jgi:hypothetical protein